MHPVELCLELRISRPSSCHPGCALLFLAHAERPRVIPHCSIIQLDVTRSVEISTPSQKSAYTGIILEISLAAHQARRCNNSLRLVKHGKIYINLRNGSLDIRKRRTFSRSRHIINMWFVPLAFAPNIVRSGVFGSPFPSSGPSRTSHTVDIART